MGLKDKFIYYACKRVFVCVCVCVCVRERSGMFEWEIENTVHFVFCVFDRVGAGSQESY